MKSSEDKVNLFIKYLWPFVLFVSLSYVDMRFTCQLALVYA